MLCVSIPFKRESGSKETQRKGQKIWYHQRFQFPSNGKADPKRHLGDESCNDSTRVSIPFKRESGSKGTQNRRRFLYRFNSLQTGKRIQSFSHLRCSAVLSLMPNYRFNSLQTGKRIQRIPVPNISAIGIVGFQFPSNGKADPKIEEWHPPGAEIMFQFPSNGKADPKSRDH